MKKGPITVINFKTYKQGKEAIELAKQLDKIDKRLIVGVQSSDIYEITSKTDLTVYSQHVDYYKPGRHTGYIIPEAVKEDGGAGSFLNHSEHRLNLETIKKTVDRCKEVGLKTMLFAGSIDKAMQLEKLEPDYLVFEPPELVGGDNSVSESGPELIEEVSQKIKMPFLVGAGINNKKDVDKAIELGASGIAIASAICKAENPGQKLRRLLGKK